VLERWTGAVLRYRLIVLALWLVVLTVGIWSATRLPELLSNSLGVPGTESDRGGTILARAFGERSDAGFTVVFRTPRPRDPAVRARVVERLAEAANAVPTGHAERLLPGGGVLYGRVETELDPKQAKSHTDDLRRALAAPDEPPAYVTGQPAVQRDLDPVLEADLRRGERIAVPIAFLILVAAFGLSPAVVLPFVFAAFTITGTLAVVYLLAHELAVVTYVTNLVALIGLGLAIDYSLLVLFRFREEVQRGSSVDAAIVRTMGTAGRAVVFSGLAVAIGLALLLLMPVPFIRSMGVGGLLIPLVSILAALTLQPALLSLVGRRGVQAYGWAPRTHDVERGLWARLARAIMRRPRAFLAAGTAMLVLAAIPALFLEVTPASFSTVPRSLESIRGFELLVNRVAAGAATPTEVVIDAGASGRARGRAVQSGIDRLGDSLVRDPETYIVANGQASPYVDRTGRYARVIVVGRHVYGEQPTHDFVRRLRDSLVPAARFPPGANVDVAGVPAQGVDYLARAYGRFPALVAAALGLTFLILLFAFRSLLIPLKAVVLNALVVAAAYGMLVVAFRWGPVTSALGIYRADEIEGWIPIFLFATLFGLSMDYEVFLVMRMREAWDEVNDNTRAVAHGLERTGRVVTAAALIMVAAFSGFAAGDVGALQQFGVGLAFAVFLDATIVRAVLVPSLMAVLGEYNWWLPKPLARLGRAPASRLG
jgi:RND superfamily putative drug exporter